MAEKKEAPKASEGPKHYPTYKHRAMTAEEKKKHAEYHAAGRVDKKTHYSKLVRNEAEEKALDPKHKWFDEPVMIKEVAAESGYVGDLHPELGPKMSESSEYDFGD